MPYTVSTDINISITMAIISALKNKKISNEISFVGEMSLMGMILPANNLKNKLSNALSNDIGIVYISSANKNDVSNIDKDIIGKLKIKYVDNFMDIYENVLKGKNEKI